MYALLALLSIVAAGSFALAFAERRRGWRWAFAASLALSLYTHNWALFFGVGTAVAFAVLWWRSDERPALLRDGLQAYGLAGARLPALGPDARLPGAPHGRAVVGPPGPGRPLGDAGVGPGRRRAGDGLRARGARRGRRRAARSRPGPAAPRGRRRPGRSSRCSWCSSSGRSWPGWPPSPRRRGRPATSPRSWARSCSSAAWGSRGPGGSGCSAWRCSSRSGWTRARASSTTRATRTPRPPTSAGSSPRATSSWRRTRSTGRRCTSTCRRACAGRARSGFVPDPTVMDWRDALDRLRAAKPKATEDAMVRAVRPGQRLVFVRPVLRTAGWRAPWTKLVRRRAIQWQTRLDRDPRLLRIFAAPAAARPPAAAGRADHPLRARPGRARRRGAPRRPAQVRDG